METPESIRSSLIPGECVSSTDAYLHIPIHPKLKEVQFCHDSQVFQFTSLPFCLAMASQLFTMIVKEVKLDDPHKGSQTSPIPGLAYQGPSQEEAQVNTQTMVDLTQSLGWIVNQEKSELKPVQVFSLWAMNTT